jgi:hypothetical protein
LTIHAALLSADITRRRGLKGNTAGALACASALRVKTLTALFVTCLPANNFTPSAETMKLADVQ